MTPKEKRNLLIELVELNVFCGYSIDGIIGRPLSYFDFDKVKLNIEKMKKEKQRIES